VVAILTEIVQVPHIQLQLVGPPRLGIPHLVVPPHLGMLHLLVRQLEERLVLGPIDPPLRPLHIKTVTCQQAKLLGLLPFITEHQTTITRRDTIPIYTRRVTTMDTATTSTTKPMDTTSTHITILEVVAVAVA